MIEWKEFADELPKEGEHILYGNTRGLKTVCFTKSFKENALKYEMIGFKPVTHWCYFNEFPPYPKAYVSPWATANETN